VCATFPLIWVGGLVTSYDAGMSVPDWPGTYGYNLVLYPWRTWVLGPWDLFIEHGHRLLGALSGLLTIVLLGAVWRYDARRWMRKLVLGALVAVIAQGVLGGFRVLRDDTQLAMLHGCTGPLFFALCVSMAVLTSRGWLDNTQPTKHRDAVSLHRLAWMTAAFSVVQLALGAQLRHVSVHTGPHTFRLFVFFHLLVAAVLAAQIVLLAIRIQRSHRGRGALVRPALGLVLLIFLQLLLGAGTWVMKYSWPSWLADQTWAVGFTIEAEGLLQVLTVTAHVATGSLILGTSVMLALRSVRLVRPVTEHATEESICLGAVV
jgi:cytochrome c oxidase assembly protein subunit 15